MLSQWVFIVWQALDTLWGKVMNKQAESTQKSNKILLDAEPRLVSTKENQLHKLHLHSIGMAIPYEESHRHQTERVISRSHAIDLYLFAPIAASLFESTRNAVMVADAKNRILVVNRAFSELTGYSATEVIGQTVQIFESDQQDDAFYADMWAQINQNGYWQGEIKNRRKSGEVYLQMLCITAIRNRLRKVTHYIWIFSNIAQLNDIVTRLDFLAHHDPLTGLPNRLLLFARLEHCIALEQRERKSAALLMLDLDRFKHVNDRFGHFTGDDLLKQVAHRLTSRLRGIDTISRLGGDEFAILLEDLSHTQDSARLAAEIIAAIGEPFHLGNGSEVRIGASVGISLFPDHGKTSEELLQQADAALYRAKADGRGNFKYYSEELTHAALRRINLESLLRRAVIRNELAVSYQPQIEISSGNITGAEVLLSWHNAKEGIVLPSQFIPIAEETGLIWELGEWVLREACRQGQAWLAADLPPLKLAVNLSPYQFRHGNITGTVSDILSETNFPAEYLELELTESALMEREKEAVLILGKLRALGVSLAIDDFGTGYSSLAYLKRFPLNMLKIDKTFIDDIPQQENDKEIITAIIGLGHTLGLMVLAEGVETKEQLDFLRGKGCDYYQGFYKSPPLSSENFEKMLNGHALQSKVNHT